MNLCEFLILTLTLCTATVFCIYPEDRSLPRLEGEKTQKTQTKTQKGPNTEVCFLTEEHEAYISAFGDRGKLKEHSFLHCSACLLIALMEARNTIMGQIK